MAAVATTAVTINEAWKTIAPRALKGVDANIVLSNQGGTTSNIPASLFGLTTIEQVVAQGRTSADVLVMCYPSYDRAYLRVANLVDATDASRTAAADVTATIRISILGKE